MHADLATLRSDWHLAECAETADWHRRGESAALRAVRAERTHYGVCPVCHPEGPFAEYVIELDGDPEEAW